MKQTNLDFFSRAESVQLIEELEHGSLDLSISGFLRVETFCSDRVQLVDEDDRRGLLLGQSESVTDQLGAISDEHLRTILKFISIEKNNKNNKIYYKIEK
jgi:hypothetical protein